MAETVFPDPREATPEGIVAVGARPEPGLLAFAAVVIFTVLATLSFDPRMIWQEPHGTAAA